MREELIKLYTMVEALINFPEDGIDAQSRQQILDRISHSRENAWLNFWNPPRAAVSLKKAYALSYAASPMWANLPCLMPCLKNSAPLSPHIAGTTRDVLEESAQIKGIPISLVDTAGILEPRDLIEEEAVKRSHLYIKSADLVLLVLDHSRPLEEQDRVLMEQLKAARVLVVINKMDLEGR